LWHKYHIRNTYTCRRIRVLFCLDLMGWSISEYLCGLWLTIDMNLSNLWIYPYTK
jgi:hypothetical protein